MHEDQDRFAQRVRERNLAGVVWLHPQTEQVPIIRRLAKLMPVVVVGRHVTGEGVYSVTPDYVHAARLIDDHLVGLGHSTCAAVGTDLMGIYNAKWLKAIEEAHRVGGCLIILTGFWTFVPSLVRYVTVIAGTLFAHFSPRFRHWW